MKTIHTIRRPIRTTLAVLAVAAVPIGAVAAPAPGTVFAATAGATTAAAACPGGWGSLPEAINRYNLAQVKGIRAGRHACFDRLVVDLAGRPAGYDVRYVSAVYTDGAGELVPLRGGAKLQLAVRAPAYDRAFRPTYDPANPRELVKVTGYNTFRQVAFAGSWEGQTTIGLGVRARLPFRVLTLTGPGATTRIVVDVAHRW
jgi:hypothetical protein